MCLQFVFVCDLFSIGGYTRSGASADTHTGMNKYGDATEGVLMDWIYDAQGLTLKEHKQLPRAPRGG